MPTLKAGALYFAITLAAGFALGTIRVLLLVPRVGERTAELIESPLMLAVTFLTARWIVRRFAVPPVAARRLGVGLVGLGFLLLAELAGVLLLQGMTVAEFVATRDSVAGAVYLILLALFALMPALIPRSQTQ
jgi:hypothetical protein